MTQSLHGIESPPDPGRFTSWEVIGEVFNGVSKSAAQKRFGPKYTAWADKEMSSPAVTGDGHPVWMPAELLRVQALYQLADGWATAAGIIEAQQSIAELNNAMAAIMDDGSTGLANSGPTDFTIYNVRDSERDQSPAEPGRAKDLYSFKTQRRAYPERTWTFGKIEVPPGRPHQKRPVGPRLPLPTQPIETMSAKSLEERVAALELIVEELTNEATRPH